MKNRDLEDQFDIAFKYSSLFNPNEHNKALFKCHQKKMALKMKEFERKEVVDGKIFVEGLGRCVK